MVSVKGSPDAFEWVYEKHIAKDPEEVSRYLEERRKADIGQEVYDLRRNLGLSEEQLGKLAGLPAQLVHKLEVADYDGAYEEAFQRIKDALRGADDPLAVKSGEEGRSQVPAASDESTLNVL